MPATKTSSKRAVRRPRVSSPPETNWTTRTSHNLKLLQVPALSKLLRKANRTQLLSAGLRPQNIHTIDLCTACHPNLPFSYRKQGPQSGRLMSIIALRP